MLNFRPDIFSNSVDELKRLHVQVEDARRELEDAYKVVAEDMRIKPALLKKLMKKMIFGEGETDKQVDALIAEIERKLSPSE